MSHLTGESCPHYVPWLEVPTAFWVPAPAWLHAELDPGAQQQRGGGKGKNQTTTLAFSLTYSLIHLVATQKQVSTL